MKKYIWFYFKNIIAHLIVALFYGIFLSGIAEEFAAWGNQDASNLVIIIVGITSTIIFNVYLLVNFCRDTKNRHQFLQATKGALNNTKTYVKLFYFEALIQSIIIGTCQIPYCIFFSKWGYRHIETKPIEYPFVMDAGVYTMFNSSIAGVVFSMITLFAFQLIGKIIIAKKWDGERISR